ncbi:hypothetical protein M1146_07375 [Patescibacteria group bacterium]|nr:hypothetical protein [Patescibacteria group bacterium]
MKDELRKLVENTYVFVIVRRSAMTGESGGEFVGEDSESLLPKTICQKQDKEKRYSFLKNGERSFISRRNDDWTTMKHTIEANGRINLF